MEGKEEIKEEWHSWSAFVLFLEDKASTTMKPLFDINNLDNHRQGVSNFDEHRQHGWYNHTQSIQTQRDGWIKLLPAVKTQDSYQAQAMAIRRAMERTGRRTRTVFVTDCLLIINSVQQFNTDQLPSWRAAQDIAKIAQMLQLSEGYWQIKHAHRKELIAPHNMANHARRTGSHFQGRTQSSFLQKMEVALRLPATL